MALAHYMLMLFLVGKSWVSCDSSCPSANSYRRVDVHHGYELVGDVLDVTDAPTIIQCASACLAEERCTFVNFRFDQRVCRINQGNMSQAELQVEGNWSLAYPTSEPSGCLYGWTSWGGSCYRIFNNTGWNSTVSEGICHQFNSYLINVGSQEENDFLIRMIQQRQQIDPDLKKVLLGFNDQVDEGHWVWSMDEDTTNYTNWYPGQPDSLNADQNCGFIDYTPSRPEKMGYWLDYKCSHAHEFCCESKSRATVLWLL